MINYGLRGLAAYSHHAEVLGEHDREVGCCGGRRGREGALARLPFVCTACPASTYSLH